MRTAALVLWAATATVLAVRGWRREPPPARSDAPRRLFEEREAGRRLERKVRELEAALVEVVGPRAAPKEGEAALATLMEADRILQDDPNWSADKAQALARQIYARLGADPEAHLELMELLARAGDEDEVHRILSYLLENPFVRLVRSAEVTARIREKARALLLVDAPHLRAAGARVLFGYEGPVREDVLFGIQALATETDTHVYGTLMQSIAEKGRDVGLTEDDARPYLERLRKDLRGDPCCAMWLAHWSAEGADYDLVRTSFLEDPSQEALAAFQRSSRMVGPRVEECRALLLRVLRDPEMRDDVRGLAADLLRGYAPWDPATAEALARAGR